MPFIMELAVEKKRPKIGAFLNFKKGFGE